MPLGPKSWFRRLNYFTAVEANKKYTDCRTKPRGKISLQQLCYQDQIMMQRQNARSDLSEREKKTHFSIRQFNLRLFYKMNLLIELSLIPIFRGSAFVLFVWHNIRARKTDPRSSHPYEIVVWSHSMKWEYFQSQFSIVLCREHRLVESDWRRYVVN